MLQVWPSPTSNGSNAMDARVRSTIDHLERTGYAPVRVSTLADRVGLSGSRLEHLFRHDTGQSIRAFIKHRRLTRAAHLLLSTDLRVSQILYFVGFSDFSNFDHAFRRRYGMSPTEFRDRRSRQAVFSRLEPGHDIRPGESRAQQIRPTEEQMRPTDRH